MDGLVDGPGDRVGPAMRVIPQKPTSPFRQSTFLQLLLPQLVRPKHLYSSNIIPLKEMINVG